VNWPQPPPKAERPPVDWLRVVAASTVGVVIAPVLIYLLYPPFRAAGRIPGVLIDTVVSFCLAILLSGWLANARRVPALWVVVGGLVLGTYVAIGVVLALAGLMPWRR
jgi:hypothetical protein